MANKYRIFKYLLYNFIGIFVFFVPITINGKSSIVLDHITSFTIASLKGHTAYHIITMMIVGLIRTFFIKKDWNKSATGIFFTISKIAGLISGICMLFKIGPAFLFEPNVLPFLFDKLAVPLSIIIPLGGMFITFIIYYGFLEFMGVIMEGIMRPIFKTPGKSSIDAIASFVGSYSIALLLTNRVYTEGKYSLKEAVIIATGFSTVSATFMVVVAKTLNLMDMWLFYFLSCISITFIVTAITTRLYPIKSIPNSYYNDFKFEEPEIEGGVFKRAMSSALYAANSNKQPVYKLVLSNLRDGFFIASGVVPSVLSIGLLGLLLATYTPVFDYIGYIFLPLTKILGFGDDAFLVAKAVSTSIAEMFLPAMLSTGLNLQARYIIAVVCVSEILFFSASIPCILSTKIKIKLHHILIIWFERVVFSLIIAKLVAMIFLN